VRSASIPDIILNPIIAAFVKAVGEQFDICAQVRLQQAAHARVVCAQDGFAVRDAAVQKVLERVLIILRGRETIRVVVFDVGHDRDPGREPEEHAVVLIRFDYKVSADVPAGVSAELFDFRANNKAGVVRQRVQHADEHSGGRSLAM